MLALNATIEARAGEAGRLCGGRVEVKALATQTAKATDEIGTQISAMQVATKTRSSPSRKSAAIGRISRSPGDRRFRAGAGRRHAGDFRNVQHAASGTAQVATNINDVSGASETGTASAQVLASAQFLAEWAPEVGKSKIRPHGTRRLMHS